MSMTPDVPGGPSPDDAPDPFEAPSRAGWTLIALIADDGGEPPHDLAERAALGAWCAVTALWHPALLAEAAAPPTIEAVESPSPPGPSEVRILADGAADRLPSGYREQAEDAGTIL